MFFHVRNIVEMLIFTTLSVVSSSSIYQLAAGVGSERHLASRQPKTSREPAAAQSQFLLPLLHQLQTKEGHCLPQKSEVTLPVLAKIRGGMQSSPPPEHPAEVEGRGNHCTFLWVSQSI